MQVLLLSDVAKLGKKGQIVNVAEGFAMNALFPAKKAVPATSGVVAKLEEKAKAEVQKHAKLEAQAEEFKTRIEKRVLSLKCKSGADGKLFGAIREKEIAEAVSKELGTVVEKSQVVLSGAIKTLGDFTCTVKFSSKVLASVKLHITAL